MGLGGGLQVTPPVAWPTPMNTALYTDTSSKYPPSNSVVTCQRIEQLSFDNFLRIVLPQLTASFLLSRLWVIEAPHD